jgi:hypothetical protein
MDELTLMNMKQRRHSRLDIAYIGDDVLNRQLSTAVNSMLEDFWFFDVVAVKQRGWIVVGTGNFDLEHYDEHTASQLAGVFKSAQVDKLFGNIVDKRTNNLYMIHPSMEGLMQFSWEAYGMNAIVFPPDFGFMFLFTSEEFNLYAGGRDFVERCLGVNAEQAYKDYQAYSAEHEKGNNFLPKLPEKYRDVWPQK